MTALAGLDAEWRAQTLGLLIGLLGDGEIPTLEQRLQYLDTLPNLSDGDDLRLGCADEDDFWLWHELRAVGREHLARQFTALECLLSEATGDAWPLASRRSPAATRAAHDLGWV